VCGSRQVPSGDARPWDAAECGDVFGRLRGVSEDGESGRGESSARDDEGEGVRARRGGCAWRHCEAGAGVRRHNELALWQVIVVRSADWCMFECLNQK